MQKKGFGLIEVVIAIAVLAVLAGGGFYIRNIQNQESAVQTAFNAEKQAQQVVQQSDQQTKQEQNSLDQASAPSQVPAQTPAQTSPKTPAVSTTTLAQADAARVSDLSVVSAVLRLYFQANGAYPRASGATAKARWTNLNTALVPLGDLSSGLPQDPRFQITGNSYDYETSADDMHYVVKATLEYNFDDPIHRFGNDDVKGVVYGLNCNDPSYCVSG